MSALVLYSRSPTLVSTSPSTSLIFFSAASVILFSKSSANSKSSAKPPTIVSGTTARVPVPGAMSGLVRNVLKGCWSIKPRAVMGSRMPIIFYSKSKSAQGHGVCG